MRKDHSVAFPGLCWGIDATEYHDGWKLVPVSDLSCKYRFVPLIALREDGEQNALYLDNLFRQHGPPLFLKRDNGSPFNCQAVDAVLQRYRVLPLNSPPHYPRYNGAVEKSIRDFKEHLDQRLAGVPLAGSPLIAHVEAAVHELNHKPRRRLNGRTPCDLFHDHHRKLCLSQKARLQIFRLLAESFALRIENMPPRNQHEVATTWRHTVEHWLRCQNLISVRLNRKPNVSTTSQKIWSHN